jgi:hypothetical protein
MARPPNQNQAARQARNLLTRTLPGSRRGTVRGHVERAGRIGETIWLRWRVGPYQWRAKHLRWFLTTQTTDFSPSTRYRYWLTLRALAVALQKQHGWLHHLQGPWVRPNGQSGALQHGRPPKLPR